MKKIVLFALCLIAFSSFAQTTMQLAMYPKYNGQDLVLNQVLSDGNGNDFEVTRFQFYIGDFVVTHDGGLVTYFTGEDHYVLVDANSTLFTFGSGNITNVEGISFTVGVDASLNHNDPTLYPSNHPLALQSPSMHWGWASGYRFLAVEMGVDSDGDGTMEGIMQSHVVGDNFITDVNQISVTGIDLGNAIEIPINYDLGHWLHSLNVATAGTNHGGGQVNQTIMDNTNPQVVFSSGISNSINEIGFDAEIYSNAGVINFRSENVVETIEIYDLSGRQVFTKGLNQNQGQVSPGLEGGIYIVRLRSGDSYAARQLKF